MVKLCKLLFRGASCGLHGAHDVHDDHGALCVHGVHDDHGAPYVHGAHDDHRDARWDELELKGDYDHNRQPSWEAGVMPPQLLVEGLGQFVFC